MKTKFKKRSKKLKKNQTDLVPVLKEAIQHIGSLGGNTQHYEQILKQLE